MSKIYSWMGVNSLFDPLHRFETSWLISPPLLFLLRAVIALYTLLVSVLVLGWRGESGGRGFSYFTVLSYWGLSFYFLVASLHTWSLIRYGTPWLNRWPRPFQALHSCFYTTITVFPFLVTLVFWLVLYKGKGFPTTFRTWSNISQHAINSLFAACEIFLTRTSPPPWLHIVPLIIILALYLALTYITDATQHFFAYEFLDPVPHGPGRVAVFILAILIAIILIFSVVRFLVWSRQRLTEFVSSSRLPSSSTDLVERLPVPPAPDIEASSADRKTRA